MRSLQEELEEIRLKGLQRSLRELESDQSSSLIVDGKTLLNFSSNNYLGLANDPRLKKAALEATEKYGTGSGASRLVTGSMKLHHDLEKQIADFKDASAALVFNSGYQANLGTLSAFLQEGDCVYSDELNHASIIDGCRLSRASVKVYRHNDMQHLEELLQSCESKSRRLIVSDSVFSMDGDLAPLEDLAKLAEKYEAWLMLDEAHATGVFGKNGKGLVEQTWPEKRPPYLKDHLIQMGTLGKALGSFGAYVAGSKDLIDLLINKARSFIYTTSLPPAVMAAASAAIKIVESEPTLREKLWDNIRYFATQAGLHAESPIFPLVVGSSEKALEASQKLWDQGYWVQAIRYPTVAKGTERLRVTLMASHEKPELKAFADALYPCLRASL